MCDFYRIPGIEWSKDSWWHDVACFFPCHFNSPSGCSSSTSTARPSAACLDETPTPTQADHAPTQVLIPVSFKKKKRSKFLIYSLPLEDICSGFHWSSHFGISSFYVVYLHIKTLMWSFECVHFAIFLLVYYNQWLLLWWCTRSPGHNRLSSHDCWCVGLLLVLTYFTVYWILYMALSHALQTFYYVQKNEHQFLVSSRIQILSINCQQKLIFLTLIPEPIREKRLSPLGLYYSDT